MGRIQRPIPTNAIKTHRTMELKRGQEIELIIDDYAFGGKGITKLKTDLGDYIVFTQNAIPGQKIKAKILKKKKKYAECRIINVIEKSSIEKTNNYQPISGAPYISIPIDLQHDFKLKSAFELFKKLGEIKNPSELFDELIASPLSYHYRNKMEYSFSSIRHDLETNKELDDEFALGFKHAGTWWKVENLDKDSGMFDLELENKLKEIREHLKNTSLKAWHPPAKKGFFRHLVVRKSYANNQLLFNLVTSSSNLKSFNIKEFNKFLSELFKERKAGFIHTINDDVADRSKLENGNSELIDGKEVIIEKILGLNFEISMESFFQTNPKCAEKLYQKVIDYTTQENNLDNQFIMDLFCGTGTIGQIIAKHHPTAKVIGVDIVPSAIENAKENARKNKIQNVAFYADDAGKFLLNHPEYENKIGTIVIDPPRAGIAPKTLRKIIRLGAKRIVYVSCNPATQARDANELAISNYKLSKFSLVDQFPHTGHIESIMLFEKNN